MLQSADEVGARRIHPRHFVDEDNLSTFGQRFEIGFQGNKRIEPSFHGTDIGAFLPYALQKVAQLNTQTDVVHTRDIKGIVIAYDPLYQERLTDTPATIYGNKLRLLRVDIIFQLLLFLFSSDEKLFHNCLILQLIQLMPRHIIASVKVVLLFVSTK